MGTILPSRGTDEDLHASSTLRRDGAVPAGRVAFTIGTLVNDPAQYAEMRATFAAGGFTRDDCEFLYIDNTGSEQTCAYRGLNAILNQARGPYVILCHQDVRLSRDRRAVLECRLRDLGAADRSWAVAGNAGGVRAGQLAMRITDPHGSDRSVGDLPARVMSLDENFLVVRRDARIGFSNDLTGFHFYGADICLTAELLGYTAYVIDFHLEHLSAGKIGPSFAAAEEAFRRKWSRALRPRWMQTTCSLMYLSGDRLGRLAGRVAQRPLAKLSRRLPRAAGWSNASGIGGKLGSKG